MRQAIKITLIGCLVGCKVIAQQAQPLFKELSEKISTNQQDPEKTIVFKPGKRAYSNWQLNDWVFIDSGFFNYNSQGLILSYSRGQNVNSLNQRDLTTYDADNRFLEKTNQVYNSSLAVWEDEHKNTQSYDSFGNVTGTGDYSYNTSLNQWVLNSGNQYVYTYNPQEQVLTAITQIYDANLLVFNNYSRRVNCLYTAFGNPASWEEDVWENNQWKKSSRALYTYDQNGFPTEIEYQLWDSVSESFKSAYKESDYSWYNWTGHFENSLPLFLATFNYNTTSASWDPNQRTTYTYGDNGSYVSVNELFTNGAFKNHMQQTIAIDEHGNTALNQLDLWSNANSSWNLYSKNTFLFTYDQTGDLQQEIRQYWESTTSEMVNLLRYDYYDYQQYDNTTSTAEHDLPLLSVYPNPMHESVTVSTAGFNESEITIQLVDLNGVVVKTINNITGSTTEVTRDELKSGLYFVQVKSGSSVRAVTKLLVD